MKQITEDYVSFETAKLLKEKGFRAVTNRYYNAQYGQIRTVSDSFMMDWNDEEYMKSVTMPGAIAIPTHQMALKWLREVHDLHIIVYPWQADNEEKAIHWCCTVYKSFAHLGNDVYTNETPKSYEQAIEAALNYVLKNLI